MFRCQLLWLLLVAAQSAWGKFDSISSNRVDTLVQDEQDFFVISYTQNCKTCDRFMEFVEENIQLLDTGYQIFKTNDKKLQKFMNIRNFPALTKFQQGKPVNYQDSLEDATSIIDFIQDDNPSTQSQDKIELVGADELEEIIACESLVAVIFDDQSDIWNEQTLLRVADFFHANQSDVPMYLTYEQRPIRHEYDGPVLSMLINGKFIPYKGSLSDFSTLRAWVKYQKESVQLISSNFLSFPFAWASEISYSEEDMNLWNNVFVFFYGQVDKITEKIQNNLKNIETELKEAHLSFMSISTENVKNKKIANVPSLVFFKNGTEKYYEGNLLNEEEIKEFIGKEYIETKGMLDEMRHQEINGLINQGEIVLVYSYNPDEEDCIEALKQLQQIKDETDAIGIKFVKTLDKSFQKKFGIEELPTIVYFEEKQPSIYDGSPYEETELLTWLLYQMKEDTIENVNRDILNQMMHNTEYLAVFFYDDSEESKKSLRHLELIDSPVTEFGVRLVKVADNLMSKKYGHRSPPGLGYFRKKDYVKYDGDMYDEEEVLDWLTDPKIMSVSDGIENVNRKMLDKMLTRNADLAALFYVNDNDTQSTVYFNSLEAVNSEADKNNIPIVKIQDPVLAKQKGIFPLPALVFYNNYGKENSIYIGDAHSLEAILFWMMEQRYPDRKVIVEADGDTIDDLIETDVALLVLMYKEETERLEKVLDVANRVCRQLDDPSIQFVKTNDEEFIERLGVENLPSLVIFQDGIPNLYEGNLETDDVMREWILDNQRLGAIELITKNMLEYLLQDIEYMAVMFYKDNCRTCEIVLKKIETIDDDCDALGIEMVRVKDPVFAKSFGIKIFPSIVLFRNARPLTYDGDIKSETMLLKYLENDDNRRLADEIERVNKEMLEKILLRSNFVLVFFYDEECPDCDKILDELENIDEEIFEYGIDFVKIDDVTAARQFNVFESPALVFFRKTSPIVYDGDLYHSDKVQEWCLSSEVFKLPDEIDDVNRKMLEKQLEENEYLVVFFYHDDCYDCEHILDKLESIDEDTEALNIPLVKINDPRYAKKYGVTSFPSLVYFKRKFPSIYRESLMEPTQILEWIKINRFRQVEVGVFLYSMVLLGIVFLGYTVFLFSGFAEGDVKPVKKE